MRRVLVIGCSGSGKSTLSRTLARKTGLPMICLDGIHWRPGWVAPPADEWRSIVATAAAEPEWIMDGTYVGTFDLRMPRADTIIWFDYSRYRCLWQVAKRTARDYGRVREGLPDGCPERVDREFLRYIWTFDQVYRPRIMAAIERFGTGCRVVRLSSNREAADFLATITEAKCPDSLKRDA